MGFKTAGFRDLRLRVLRRRRGFAPQFLGQFAHLFDRVFAVVYDIQPGFGNRFFSVAGSAASGVRGLPRRSRTELELQQLAQTSFALERADERQADVFRTEEIAGDLADHAGSHFGNFLFHCRG